MIEPPKFGCSATGVPSSPAVTLTASVSTPDPVLTASDGEARIIAAGEVILVEDTTGKGHLSKAVEGQIRHCIFVPVE